MFIYFADWRNRWGAQNQLTFRRRGATSTKNTAENAIVIANTTAITNKKSATPKNPAKSTMVATRAIVHIAGEINIKTHPASLNAK